jgi:ribokinase
VTLIACVGADQVAGDALAILETAGIDLRRVAVSADRPTGIALIVVDDDGENQIVVASGANADIGLTEIDASGFEAVICQFEIPESVVDVAVRSATGFVVVNPAPARPISDAVRRHADLIVVNSVEHDELAESFQGHTGMIAITEGAEGARIEVDGRVIARQRPPSVDAIDTVGAGDTFVGALTVELVDGATPGDALRWACAAGALATTRPGAQPSIPTRDEVSALLATM